MSSYLNEINVTKLCVGIIIKIAINNTNFSRDLYIVGLIEGIIITIIRMYFLRRCGSSKHTHAITIDHANEAPTSPKIRYTRSPFPFG